MEKTKTLPMSEVRKILGDGMKTYFGMMPSVQGDLRETVLKIHTGEENVWDRAEVSISLDTDIYGEEVRGYHISYSSRWQNAEFADLMSVLIGGAAQVAKKLEEAGVPCKH